MKWSEKFTDETRHAGSEHKQVELERGRNVRLPLQRGFKYSITISSLPLWYIFMLRLQFFSISREGSGFYCKLTLDGSVCYGVITNHHVLESREDCNRGYATFFYEGSENRLRVKLSPSNTFRTHPVSFKQSLGCILILNLKVQLKSMMKEPWNI